MSRHEIKNLRNVGDSREIFNWLDRVYFRLDRGIKIASVGSALGLFGFQTRVLGRRLSRTSSCSSSCSCHMISLQHRTIENRLWVLPS
jgi:hypothetical protein